MDTKSGRRPRKLLWLIFTLILAVPQNASAVDFEVLSSDLGLYRDLLVDPSGNVFATGEATLSFPAGLWVGKYDPAGVLLSSEAVIIGGGGQVAGYAIARDSAGNIFVAGQHGTDGAWLLKYDSSLVLISSRTDSSANYAGSLIIDNSDRVYVAGSAPSGSNDPWVARYDGNLNLQSSATISTPGISDYFNDIAIGQSGDVFLVGRVGNEQGAVKYNSDLVFVSSAVVERNATSIDLLNGLAIDSSGNIYVVGNTSNPINGGEAFIAKLDSNLVLLSTAVFNTGRTGTFLEGMEIDSAGRIYAVGYDYAPEPNGSDEVNVLLARLDSTLNLERVQTYDNESNSVPPNSTTDLGFALAFDASGDIYFAGLAHIKAWLRKVTTSEFEAGSSGGQVVSVDSGEGIVRIVIPPGAFVSSVSALGFVTFQIPTQEFLSPGLSPTGVMFTIRFIPALSPQIPLTISLPYQDSDILGMDENKLIVTRYDEGRKVWIPLSSSPDPANNRVAAITDHFSVFQIMQSVAGNDLSKVKAFPNPLRPAQGHTAMTFSNLPSGARLKIYSFLGELIRDLTTDSAGAVSWDGKNANGRSVASGVYFVLTKSGTTSRVIKVAVQR